METLKRSCCWLLWCAAKTWRLSKWLFSKKSQNQTIISTTSLLLKMSWRFLSWSKDTMSISTSTTTFLSKSFSITSWGLLAKGDQGPSSLCSNWSPKRLTHKSKEEEAFTINFPSLTGARQTQTSLKNYSRSCPATMTIRKSLRVSAQIVSSRTMKISCTKVKNPQAIVKIQRANLTVTQACRTPFCKPKETCK